MVKKLFLFLLTNFIAVYAFAQPAEMSFHDFGPDRAYQIWTNTLEFPSDGILTASNVTVQSALNTLSYSAASYTEVESAFLKLDQTTPQTVSNGAPTMDGGLILGVGQGLKDADGDTKIQVEESADEDIIRFDANGTQRMTIGSGDSVVVSSDGTKSITLDPDPAKVIVHSTDAQLSTLYSNSLYIETTDTSNKYLQFGIGGPPASYLYSITGAGKNAWGFGGTDDVWLERPQAHTLKIDGDPFGDLYVTGTISSDIPEQARMEGLDSSTETQITGTVSITSGTTALTGSGTSFTTELEAGDRLRIDETGLGNADETVTIASVTDNTNAVTYNTAKATHSGKDAYEYEPYFITESDGKIGNDFLPMIDDKYNLGSQSFRWKDAWLSGVLISDSDVVTTAAFEVKDSSQESSLTGTLSITQGATEITGSGTAFISEVSTGDRVRLDDTNDEFFTITSVSSNVSMDTSYAAAANHTGVDGYVYETKFVIEPDGRILGGAGGMKITGNVGFGNQPINDAIGLVVMQNRYELTDGAWTGILSNITVESDASTANGANALNATLAGSAGSGDVLSGIFTVIDVNASLKSSSAPSNIDDLRGINMDLAGGTGGSNHTDLYGIKINLKGGGIGSNTITNYYGIFLTDESGSYPSTITNHYSIYQEDEDATNFFEGKLALGTSGVELSDDGDGALVITGASAGFDESLTINLDDTENTAVISSGSGVTAIDFSAINLTTTGTIDGATINTGQGDYEIQDADDDGSTKGVASFDGTDFDAVSGNVTIVDDGHAHTTTSISGLDISDDTNLTAGDHITLTDDDLDVDDDFLLNNTDDEAGGDIGFPDSKGVVLGTNDDFRVDWNETDDVLSLRTADRAAANVDYALITVAADTGNSSMTADQEVFEVGKGGEDDSNANFTELMSVDEDGDLNVTGSGTFGGVTDLSTFADIEVTDDATFDDEVHGSLTYLMGGGDGGSKTGDGYLKGFNGQSYSATLGIPMPFDGSITAVACTSNFSAATGVWNFEVHNGGSQAFYCQISVTGAGNDSCYDTQARDTDTFSAGDILSLYANELSGTVDIDDIQCGVWGYFSSTGF